MHKRSHGGPSKGTLAPESCTGCTALRLEAEFDPRLADVWLSVFELCQTPEQRMPEELGWFLRMAYLRGYEDALTESERGALFRRFGVDVPGVAVHGQRSRRGGK